MPQPTVSIVIPCFNGEAWIRQALESAWGQGLTDLEVIVVDDGSTDASAGIVERDFKKVRLIRQEQSGPSRARNAGTEASLGRFLQYLDVDDLLAPGKLKAQLQQLEETCADVAYGGWEEQICQPDGNFKVRRSVLRRMEGPPEIALFTDFWCPPAVYLFRREIVEKTGGWNERFPVIQDARFVLDCALQGGRFACCPGMMAYYRIHSSSSVSRRDTAAFVRDCLQNAIEIEEIWEKQGGISKDRRRALLKVYGYAARASFAKDRATFEAAYCALNRLKPGYAPDGPRNLAVVSRILGYRNAEHLALWYRKMGSLLGQNRFSRSR